MRSVVNCILFLYFVIFLDFFSVTSAGRGGTTAIFKQVNNTHQLRPLALSFLPNTVVCIVTWVSYPEGSSLKSVICQFVMCRWMLFVCFSPTLISWKLSEKRLWSKFYNPLKSNLFTKQKNENGIKMKEIFYLQIYKFI